MGTWLRRARQCVCVLVVSCSLLVGILSRWAGICSYISGTRSHDWSGSHCCKCCSSCVYLVQVRDEVCRDALFSRWYNLLCRQACLLRRGLCLWRVGSGKFFQASRRPLAALSGGQCHPDVPVWMSPPLGLVSARWGKEGDWWIRLLCNHRRGSSITGSANKYIRRIHPSRRVPARRMF